MPRMTGTLQTVELRLALMGLSHSAQASSNGAERELLPHMVPLSLAACSGGDMRRDARPTQSKQFRELGAIFVHRISTATTPLVPDRSVIRFIHSRFTSRPRCISPAGGVSWIAVQRGGGREGTTFGREEESVFEKGAEGRDIHGGNGDARLDQAPLHEVDTGPGIVCRLGEVGDVDDADNGCCARTAAR